MPRAYSTVSDNVTWCDTPLDITVTGMEYVPAGVLVLPSPPGGVVPPPPPPDPAQLDKPPATISPAKTNKMDRRLFHASGNSSSPHATWSARHPPTSGLIAADCDCPVTTWTVTLPVVLAATVTLEGLNLQAAWGDRLRDYQR